MSFLLRYWFFSHAAALHGGKDVREAFSHTERAYK